MKKIVVGFLILIALVGTVCADTVVADFSANITAGAAPLTVGFTDLSVNATGWVWYFGDESYTSPWQQMNASDGFNNAFHTSAVGLPDGSIVYCPAANLRNETYRSTDNGATWQLVNSSGGWAARIDTYNSMVVLSDGTIVKMGGSDGSTTFYNDTWTSTDKGSTWQLANASSGWSARSNTAACVLSDDSIVLTGGDYGDNNSGVLNDVWRSTDKGVTWTQVNASPGWAPRAVHTVVSLADDSIVLMGGFAGSNMNDTWLSTDKGYTWTQVSASSEWAARRALNAAVMPDDSIVLLGGITGDSTYLSDVWRSTDKGSTWTQVNSNAFSPRASPAIVVTSDGSLVVIDGLNATCPNDIWRLRAEGSTEQNPLHTYSTPGTYQVTLHVYNSDGYTRKTGYITVYPPIPVADFSGSPQLGAAPLTVTFNDLSTGAEPLTWAWDFGDASSENATEQNPVHTYSNPGTYNVSLTVTNDIGTNATIKTDFITVKTAPVADFNGTPRSGTAPLAVTFTDNSTAPLTWEWDFGDESYENATEQNPVHTYVKSGTFTVSLTVTNDVGSDTTTLTDYITVSAVPPVADFSGEPVSGPAPLTVTFTDGSTGTPPLTWTWDFGDGATSTEQNPVHTYVNAGTFNVSLTVTNTGGSNTKTLSNHITVSAIPPVADFSGKPVSGPAPLTVTFTDASTGTAPLSWAWDFGDGTGDTVQSPAHTYVNAGTFNVSLTVTNAGGMDAKTLTSYITVSAVPPVADFNGEPVSGPAPLTVTFTDNSTAPLTWAWDFGDGATSSEQSPSHTYVNAGTFTVSLTVTNDIGSDIAEKTAYITVTPEITGGDQIGVSQNGWWYLDTDGSYAWNTGDTSFAWGSATDKPILGDWNGDGRMKSGAFRNGTWILDYDGTGTWSASDKVGFFGGPGSTPLVGDWNNDLKDEIGISQNGWWYLDSDGSYAWNTGDTSFAWGSATDKPILGDWNGDGKMKAGVFRNGLWILDYDGTGTWSAGDKVGYYGGAGSTPIVGDWNTDNKDEIGVYHDVWWYLDNDGSNTWNTGDTSFAWGNTGDKPVPGDWNGDGKMKAGVFRAGTWVLDYDGNGTWSASDKVGYYGGAGSTPVVGKW